ncbi:DUF1430 domain-containing protein [Fusibacter sp. JL216-2]|uniref:DUF1430 domain-containing protein n=1 Tax=Fusibacter sp. JL216-2 TaxID=3071453 RepID=UPI003D34AFCB
MEDNQKYFTYNIFSGDEKNYVIDPVAVIYNDSMDTSCIGSIATRALFYKASSNISAYGEILPLIQKHNTYEIIGAYSVYSDMNGYLFKLIERIYFNLICAVVAAIVLSAVSAFYLWFYYQNNSKKIYILHLHGYSFWEAHKQVLTNLCMTNLIAILVLVIITRSTLIIFYGLMTIFFIESIVVSVVVKKLDNNNSKLIIEGGRL